MKCPYCDNEVPGNTATCPSCGAAVPQQAQPQAAPQAAPQAQPQPQVVVVQQAPPQPQPGQQTVPLSDKSRVAYVLLGLFLGGLGVHNFYAGRTGAGVFQLLITLLTGWLIFPLGIVGLWVLIEICVVTTDGSGRRFC